MGCHPNITATKFPKQSKVGEPCKVLFHYGAGGEARGVIVRDDVGEPWIGIIKLDDGRHILFTECQYQPLSLALPKGSA
jgi:hypothetical protein